MEKGKTALVCALLFLCMEPTLGSQLHVQDPADHVVAPTLEQSLTNQEHLNNMGMWIMSVVIVHLTVFGLTVAALARRIYDHLPSEWREPLACHTALECGATTGAVVVGLVVAWGVYTTRLRPERQDENGLVAQYRRVGLAAFVLATIVAGVGVVVMWRVPASNPVSYVAAFAVSFVLVAMLVLQGVVSFMLGDWEEGPDGELSPTFSHKTPGVVTAMYGVGVTFTAMVVVEALYISPHSPSSAMRPARMLAALLMALSTLLFASSPAHNPKLRGLLPDRLQQRWASYHSVAGTAAHVAMLVYVLVAAADACWDGGCNWTVTGGVILAVVGFLGRALVLVNRLRSNSTRGAGLRATTEYLQLLSIPAVMLGRYGSRYTRAVSEALYNEEKEWEASQPSS